MFAHGRSPYAKASVGMASGDRQANPMRVYTLKLLRKTQSDGKNVYTAHVITTKNPHFSIREQYIVAGNSILLLCLP